MATENWKPKRFASLRTALVAAFSFQLLTAPGVTSPVTVDDLPRRGSLGLGFGPSEAGVAVSVVAPGSPSEDLLETGDTLVSIDGTPVVDLPTLTAATGSLPANTPMKKQLTRNGEDSSRPRSRRHEACEPQGKLRESL